MKNDIVADLVSSLSDSMQMQGEYADILQEMKSENAFLLELVEENGIPLTAYETHAGDSEFGNGFYLGTKERQTLFRVSNEANPFEYKFSIPSECINDNNTIALSRDIPSSYFLSIMGRNFS